MKNIPRIFIDNELAPGVQIPATPDTAHYLMNVMRIKQLPGNAPEFLVFNNGLEFNAKLIAGAGKKSNVIISVLDKTPHTDPSNELTLAFAPIKQSRLEEMLSMATQMGVRKLVPVITDNTNAKFINWERIKKIITEASEQSNRNSIPELSAPILFKEFIKNYDKNNCTLNSAHCTLIYADERAAHDVGSPPVEGCAKRGVVLSSFGLQQKYCHEKFVNHPDPTGHPSTGVELTASTLNSQPYTLLIGPEGGFSDAEFSALDTLGAHAMSLGRTILRSEAAAIALIAKVLNP